MAIEHPPCVADDCLILIAIFLVISNCHDLLPEGILMPEIIRNFGINDYNRIYIYIYGIYWQQYDCQMVNTESPLWTLDSQA